MPWWAWLLLGTLGGGALALSAAVAWVMWLFRDWGI